MLSTDLQGFAFTYDSASLWMLAECFARMCVLPGYVATTIQLATASKGKQAGTIAMVTIRAICLALGLAVKQKRGFFRQKGKVP